jgi:hypothetical protein
MSEKLQTPPVTEKRTPGNEDSRDIDAIAWAMLFIWAGTTLLIHAGLGWFLLGLGAIMAGAELVRFVQGQKIDGFWLACGVVALIAGALEHAHLSWRLAPILLIVLGAGVLLNVILTRLLSSD